jgi:hypothetical protein
LRIRVRNVFRTQSKSWNTDADAMIAGDVELLYIE